MIEGKLKEVFKDWPDLNLYLELMASNSKNLKKKGETEEHHILPKSIFPEFSNLRKYKWNKVNLSYYDHFMAHVYLANTGNYHMLSALKIMSEMNLDRFDSDTKEIIADIYSKKKAECILKQSAYMKNKMGQSRSY